MAQEFNTQGLFGVEDDEKNPFEIDEGMLLGEPSEDADINPMMLAGLGLGGGIVASQTGGMPSTSGLLSSFAQKVAAQDAAKQAASTAQARASGAVIGRNLPAGGANPAVTGSVKPGTLQNVSNILGRNLPAGGANPEVTGRVRSGTFSSAVKPTVGLAGATLATKPALALLGGYMGGKAIDALVGSGMRGVGLTEREGGLGAISGESLGESIFGDGNLPAFSEEELAQIQQGSIQNDQIATPTAPVVDDEPSSISKLGSFFNPIASGGPGFPPAFTPPSVGATQAEDIIQLDPIVRKLDPSGDEAILARRAERESQFAPTGGLTTVGGAPLSEFLSGQAMPESGFTRPERLLSGRGVTLTPEQMDARSTRADAFSDYEDQAAAREARLDARPDFGAAISDRESRGTGEMSMADAVDLAGGDRKKARAMIIRQRQGLNPITGNREKTEEERAQASEARELDLEIAQARLDEFKKEKPTAFEKAKENVDAAIKAGILAEAERKRAMLIALGLAPRDANGTPDFSEFMGGGSKKPSFATEAEALASGVKGEVTIGGRPAII